MTTGECSLENMIISNNHIIKSKVLVAPTIPMEDQDSEEYCEVTALAVEMMRPPGCHNEKIPSLCSNYAYFCMTAIRWNKFSIFSLTFV